MQVFRHCPGYAEAVKGAGAPAYLVQDHQAPGGGFLQDISRLPHLDHEGALPPGQIVRGPYPGKDPVNQADGRLLSRHEPAHLGHQADQGHLADIGGFARHVGAGDDDQLVIAAVQAGVVRDKGLEMTHPLDNRMPPARDDDLILVRDPGPVISIFVRHLGQGEQGIEGADGRGGALNSAVLPCQPLPQLPKKLVLQGLDPFLGPQDLILVLLELRRDEPLGIGQGLLADVVLRNQIQVGPGDLDVVAEDLIVSHL